MRCNFINIKEICSHDVTYQYVAIDHNGQEDIMCLCDKHNEIYNDKTTEFTTFPRFQSIVRIASDDDLKLIDRRKTISFAKNSVLYLMKSSTLMNVTNEDWREVFLDIVNEDIANLIHRE